MDTIAAQATPPGNGGVGIIRISGSEVTSIANKILGKLPSPRYADYLPFLDDKGDVIDYGIAIYFKAPHSFTGEDVLELQGHGGQVVLDMLITRILDLGARPAQPGEFSKRAFLNDKMDLAQAEAVADLISASSTTAAKSAMRSLSGEFSNVIHQLLEELIHLRMYIESSIDFAEEEIDFLADEEIKNRFEKLVSQLQQTFVASQQGYLLNEGMTVVILGQPNTGKSSLLNRLAQRETAIVTDIAGTTRDVIREHIQLDGLPIHVIDTAGLREQGDVVEKEGMRRAWNEVRNADRVLFIADDSKGLEETDRRLIADIPQDLGISLVFNKIDVSQNKAEILEFEDIPAVRISAKTGEGLDLLSRHLKQIMGMQSNPEGVFLARRRHIDALERALEAVQTAQHQLLEHYAGELVAEDLRQAQGALNEITGEFDNEDLLGRIFSSFCIGK